MRTRASAFLTVSAMAVAVVALLMVVVPIAGQEAGYRALRLPGTDQPDLNGLWQAQNTANWDIQDHPAQAGPLLALGAWGSIPAGMGENGGAKIDHSAAV